MPDANGASLTEDEVRQFVGDWFKCLDVHAPAEDLLAMVADDGLEMRFPEATLHTRDQFRAWYEGVIRKFFDEVHELKAVDVKMSPEQADIDLTVNWQARTWSPPAPHSDALNFDAIQRWTVKRAPSTGKPVVAAYIVDALNPVPGSTRS